SESSRRSPRDPGTDEEDHKDSRRSSHRRRKKHSASDEDRDEERPRRRERTRYRSPKRSKDRTKEDDTSVQGESLDKSKRHRTYEEKAELSHSKLSERRPRDRENDAGVDTPPQEASTSRRPQHRQNEKKLPSKDDRSRLLDEDVDDKISDILEDGAPAYSSKMDKYFSKDYDPRLDVSSALSATDGFIPPGAFDNWDYMLQVVRQRREEKEEKKRLEKLYGSDSSSKKKKAKSTNENMVSGEMAELLSMQYTKRGAVREWDEGKK
ncbi:16271_t:CDS:1, partial [Acaulospora colombiana]